MLKLLHIAGVASLLLLNDGPAQTIDSEPVRVIGYTPGRGCDANEHWQANVGDCVYSPPGWYCDQVNSSTTNNCHRPGAPVTWAIRRTSARAPEVPVLPLPARLSLSGATDALHAALDHAERAREAGTRQELTLALAFIDSARKVIETAQNSGK